MSTLDIPLDILQRGLPSQNLSICDFLAFKISQKSDVFLARECHISDQPPNASVKNIKDLLLTTEPSSSLIKELTLFLESVSSPMPQSLVCQDVKSAQTM
jgi:hypothetical protein